MLPTPSKFLGLSPGQVATRGMWSRRLPTWAALVATLMFSLGMLLVFNWDVLPTYRSYFLSNAPAVQMGWDALSASMGEDELQARFGTALDCRADGPGAGDRSCTTHVRQADGYRAMTVAFVLRGGKLRAATVSVPSWAHDEARAMLMVQYGPGEPSWAVSDMDLTRWRVHHGYLDMNSASPANPLSWSAIVWTPQRGVQPPARAPDPARDPALDPSRT